MESAEKFRDTHLLLLPWDSSPPVSTIPRVPVSRDGLRLELSQQSSASGKRHPTPQINGHARSSNQITADQLAELKAISRKRDLLVEKRVGLNVLKRNCIPHRNFNREALKACQDAGKSWRASITYGHANGDSFSLLERALEQLEKSYPGLLAIEEQVRQAENALNALESRLQKQEQKFYNKWKELIDSHVSKNSVPSDLESTSSTYSKSSTEASSTPPLAREYYSQAKQAFILRGRLRDFQEAHLRAVEARKRSQDLNQPVEPSEKNFLETYFTELTTMYKEYYNTRERATQLKAQCRRLGIKVEDEQDTASNVDALNGPTRVERNVIHQVAMRKSSFRGVTALEELLFGYTDSNARVEEWRASLALQYRPHEPADTSSDNYKNILQDTAGRSTSPTSGLQDFVAQPASTCITPSEHVEGIETILEAAEIQAYTSWSKKVEDARFPGERPKRRYSYSIHPTLDSPLNDCSIDVILPSRPKSIC